MRAWGRLRFAIDATPYPRPDAECSPGRGHVHHDACRCDGTRKAIPGWEYQFVAAAGNGGAGAPLVILDAGYSAAGLTAALRGCPVHLLIRLSAGSVFYADPVTWPGKKGRPGKHGMPVTCAGDPAQASPEPDESLTLPGTPRYGTVRVSAWHQVHPLIHGGRGYFAGWDGDLPVLRLAASRILVHRPQQRLQDIDSSRL